MLELVLRKIGLSRDVRRLWASGLLMGIERLEHSGEQAKGGKRAGKTEANCPEAVEGSSGRLANWRSLLPYVADLQE